MTFLKGGYCQGSEGAKTVEYTGCWIIPFSNLYCETLCWTQNVFFSFAKGSEEIESVMNTDLLR